jgi:hypothetical protein
VASLGEADLQKEKVSMLGSLGEADLQKEKVSM